jgi:uncharacterized OB-fold protein
VTEREAGWPHPQNSDESQRYWEAARRHELLLQACLDCGDFWFPPGPVCPACLSSSFEWRSVSGRGWVATWVVFHRAFTPVFIARVPYIVAHVELAEGPRLGANIIETPVERLRVGLEVEVVFERIDARLTLPQFRVVEKNEAGSVDTASPVCRKIPLLRRKFYSVENDG